MMARTQGAHPPPATPPFIRGRFGGLRDKFAPDQPRRAASFSDLFGGLAIADGIAPLRGHTASAPDCHPPEPSANSPHVAGGWLRSSVVQRAGDTLSPAPMGIVDR